MSSSKVGLLVNDGLVDANSNIPQSETIDITTAKFKVSQEANNTFEAGDTLTTRNVKRQDTQKNAFTRWLNSKISQVGSPIIKDLFFDLRDGNNLLTLLELLTGRKTDRVYGKLRLHKLNNVNVALELLKEYKIKLVNIGNTDIVDGVPVPTLGLVWSIIYRFQIQGALADILRIEKGPSSPVDEKDAEKAIRAWCAEAVKDYEGVDIKNFSTSWKDGLAFNALIHRYKPNLFLYKSLLANSPLQNLEHAFSLAEKAFGVHRLLEPSDFQREMIDSRLVVLYISTLYEKLKELEPKPDETVTLEEIGELNSYIKTEMEYLASCEEFFASAKDISDVENFEELTDQYRELISFIDELEPHQVKVGELVNQIESLIAQNLIAEEEAGPLQIELDALKKLWQTIFDKTSSRQDRLRGMLLDFIEKPIKVADDELLRCKEKLHEFSSLATELEPAFDQYLNFMEYIGQLRLLEAKIEAIRTGEEAGDALDVLSDEDTQVVSTNIQGMIEAFVDLGENVAEVKNRLADNLLKFLFTKIEGLEAALSMGEKIVSDDWNNNSQENGLKMRLSTYQDQFLKVDEMGSEIQYVSSLSSKIDDNFYSEGDEDHYLKQRIAHLEEGSSDLINILNQRIQESDSSIGHCTDDTFPNGHGVPKTASSPWPLRKEEYTYSASSSQQRENRQSRLLGDWTSKFSATWALVELADERIRHLGDMKSWNPNDKEIKDLEEEFSRWEDTIQSTEDFGSMLLNDDFIDAEGKDTVRKDMNELASKWENVKSQKSSAQVSRTKDQIESKGKLDHWKSELQAAMVWIREKEKELESMDDLESSLVMLEDAATKMESLYSEISNYQEKIDSVVKAGSKIIKDEEVDSDSVPSIRSDIRSLESTWELLREKCTAVQLSIQEKVAIRQVQEKEFMMEWHETFTKIEFWLLNAENEAGPFDKARDNIIDVENQVSEHEELVFRLATDEKTINDLLDVGENLAGQKLRMSENKMKVKGDLKSLKKRKTKLNARLIGQQESLTSYLDHLGRMESEVFDLWVQHCKEVEKTLLDLGKTENNESIDTVDGARDYMHAEQELLAEIGELKPEVDSVLEGGNEVLSSGRLGKLKRQGVKTAMKSLSDLFDKKQQNAFSRLKEIQEELSNMQRQQMEQVTNWISKCETFDRWIDSESKDLDALFSFTEEEDTGLEKVLAEEQAIREIKANADSRTSILEALAKEGTTLKENKNVESDLPEEYSHVIELLVSIQYKWEVLQKSIDEKSKRVIGLVSEMQGQLLSVCVNQLKTLEDLLQNLGPISDGFDTLAKDAEELSEMFMMLGQTRGNMARFDKYAKDLQTSEDVLNSAKFEVREANEALVSRISAVSTSADERKSSLHERIIDVLTESLVALNDTISSLELKCDDLVIPDNLETVDLVERYATLEDILKRLIACDVSLKDIESLGQAADNCMVLETGEPDDITSEIEARKAFIDHVQRIAREKKSRIYGLMLYTFKRRIEELDKLLSNIEEGLTAQPTNPTTIQSALENMRDNEASLQELVDIQKDGEEVTMQVNEIIESKVITNQDKDELQEKNRIFVDHLSEVFTVLRIENSSLKQAFNWVVKEKLSELREWLDMMEKRREGDDHIGPDSMAIKKQITEMSVVESQLKGKILTPEIHYGDEVAISCLDAETLEGLKEAEHDWRHLSEWIAHRTKLLQAAQEAWENFRQVEVDLLDYLRDKERQIKNWEPINLEDENAVSERLSLLREMLSMMEGRKDGVENMHNAADEVIDLIGNETAMANSIKSQVADIHDCWNNTVRQIIEAISKLNFAKEQLQNLEEGISEIRLWLDDAKSILKFYTPDVPEDVMEELKPRVEKKCTEEVSKRNTLKRVNYLSKELLDDVDGPSHDLIHTDLAKLNKDWNEVTTDLERKKDMKKRPCCWWCYRRWFLKYGYYN